MRLFLSMKMKNDQKYNSILTIIYHVMKYALFILIQNDITAADFAELFFEHVVYNNICNHIIQMSSNRLLHRFNCKIHIDIMNNVIKKRISVVKDHVEKLHKLHQKLCL